MSHFDESEGRGGGFAHFGNQAQKPSLLFEKDGYRGRHFSYDLLIWLANKLKIVRRRVATVAPEVDHRIFVIRGQKIMLGTDLAELYRVTAKAFNQAVRRNPARFPQDFMFQLTKS